MTHATIAEMLQAAPSQALPGTWKLARGRAITLRPGTNGILKVAHGMVWATTDGPHGRSPDDAGDQFLEVGRSMWIQAGQKVVIEGFNASGASYFSWDPVLAPVDVPAARRRISLAEVMQPLADLRAALGLVGAALDRLAVGIGHIGLELVRGRGHKLPAHRPHRAMC
jgi:Protein of unknown function (DUF2917)